MRTLNKVGSAFLRVLVKRMRDLGLNQSDLARRMKCSRAYISRVLQGDVNFTFTTAAHFAHALGMDFIPGLAEYKDDAAVSSPSTSSPLSPQPSAINRSPV